MWRSRVGLLLCRVSENGRGGVSENGGGEEENGRGGLEVTQGPLDTEIQVGGCISGGRIRSTGTLWLNQTVDFMGAGYQVRVRPTNLAGLVVVDVASAAWSSNLRLLIVSAPSQDSNLTSTVKGAPLASPSNTTASATPLGEKGSPTIPSKDAPNLTPPVDERKKETKDDQVKDNADPKAESQADNETCDGSAGSCWDSKPLIACIKSVDDGKLKPYPCRQI